MHAKLEVSNVIYALFILKQNNVRYGVIYYFSAVSFNYGGRAAGAVGHGLGERGVGGRGVGGH